MPLNRGDSGTPGAPKPKEEDKGFLGNVIDAINPIRKVQRELEGTDNDVAKNVSGALNLFDPTKVVPAFAGQTLKTVLETARLPTSLAGTGYAGLTGKALPGMSESGPTSFLFNTDYIRNMARDDLSLGEKMAANIQSGSPLISGVLQGGLETGGRLGIQGKAGVTRQSASEAAKGTRLEGRSYEDLAKRGEAGEAILQDILTVAPIARGLGTAAGEAGIISKVNAGRIARGTAAIERAPLAPVSIPLRGGYSALQKAAMGETAFPRLAAATEGTGLAGISNTLERGAQNIGQTWANTAMRDQFFAERARLMQGEPGAAAIPEAPLQAAEAPMIGETAPLAPNRWNRLIENAQAVDAWNRWRNPETGGLQGRPELQLKGAIEGEAGGAAIPGTRSAPPELQTLAPEVEAIGAGRLGLTPEEMTGPRAGQGYAEVFRSLEEKATGFEKGTPEFDAVQAQIKNLQEALDIEAEANTKFNIQRGARAAEAAKTGKKISEVEVPERFNDAAINKAFKGLDPQKYGDNFWVGLYDKGIQMWKDGVLALNPKWQGGNVVNNSVTAMTFGDVKGSWLTKENLGRIMKEIDNPTEGSGAVIGAGQAGQFGQVTGTGKIARLKQKMYNANQVVDDVSHVGVYLNKLDELRAAGVAEKAAQTQAAQFANQTMGNFQNMSPFERDIMRRVAPFYAWSKHATKMSLRELALRPEKIARISAKANLALGPNQERREGTDFLKSRTPWGGGQVLQLPGGAEQGTPLGIVESPLVNPAKMMGALSPILQIPAVAAGFNPRKGEMLSYAPGQSMASRVAGYGTNMIPATATLADMIEGSPLGRGDHVIKGDVREPILAGGRPIASTNQSLGPIDAPLLRFFTGVSLDRPDVEGSVARAVKAEKKAEKSEKNYGKQSGRAAKQPKKK